MRDFLGPEESKCHNYSLDRQGSEELQTGHPLLHLWEGDGANSAGNHFQRMKDKKVLRLYEMEIMLNQPDSFLQ